MRKNILSILFLTISLFLSSCSENKNEGIKDGNWRGVLVLENETGIHELPFNFTVSGETGKKIIEISNAEEKITIDEIYHRGDTIIMKLPFFENEFIVVSRNDSLIGNYIHNSRNVSYTIPFYAVHGVTDRFINADVEPQSDVSGKWEAIFNEGTEMEHTIIGEFNQVGDLLMGTFLTATGDYRFLEGKVSGNKFMLSCFDGAHSLLFKADVSEEGTLENGVFLGGPRWNGSWRAFRNEDISLPDPDTLTYLNEGYEKMEFSFKNIDGNLVSPDDEKYKNKVLIVQIIGSWCPNCLDETRLFAEYYERFNSKGLEIIALCFESDNYEKSRKSIKRFKDDLKAGYDFLYAGSAKKGRLESLPMLNRISSFPTAVFIDRKGEIRKIHTGFLGPGTDDYYDEYVLKTTMFIESLLKEETI